MNNRDMLKICGHILAKKAEVRNSSQLEPGSFTHLQNRPYSLIESASLSVPEIQSAIKSMQAIKRHHDIKLDKNDIRYTLKANRIHLSPSMQENLRF